jgi:hypothetical protein
MAIVAYPSPRSCRTPPADPHRGICCASAATLLVLRRRYSSLLRDPTTPPGLIGYCRAVLEEIRAELARRRTGRDEVAA